jgi:hypothetical protein
VAAEVFCRDDLAFEIWMREIYARSYDAYQDPFSRDL